MQQKTLDHLATAERNRIVATRLISDTDSTSISSEWATVATFYSAVHLLIAFLWERQSFEPSNHEERTRFVALSAELREHAPVYQRLSINAFHARYTPEFRISSTRSRQFIDRDLSALATAVVNALDES